jgi:N-acetylglucosamine-6-phosphate deacetylase
MPPVGGMKEDFTLQGRAVVAKGGRCVAADGTLAGSNIDMASAVRNCVTLLGVPLTDALRFASANPAVFLGVDDRLGRLAPGYRADMVALDPLEVRVLQSWVAGK